MAQCARQVKSGATERSMSIFVLPNSLPSSHVYRRSAANFNHPTELFKSRPLKIQELDNTK